VEELLCGTLGYRPRLIQNALEDLCTRLSGQRTVSNSYRSPIRRLSLP